MGTVIVTRHMHHTYNEKQDSDLQPVCSLTIEQWDNDLREQKPSKRIVQRQRLHEQIQYGNS